MVTVENNGTGLELAVSVGMLRHNGTIAFAADMA